MFCTSSNPAVTGIQGPSWRDSERQEPEVGCRRGGGTLCSGHLLDVHIAAVTSTLTRVIFAVTSSSSSNRIRCFLEVRSCVRWRQHLRVEAYATVGREKRLMAGTI